MTPPQVDELALVTRQNCQMEGDQICARRLGLQFSLDLPGLAAQLEGATTRPDRVAGTLRNPFYDSFEFAVDLAQAPLKRAGRAGPGDWGAAPEKGRQPLSARTPIVRRGYVPASRQPNVHRNSRDYVECGGRRQAPARGPHGRRRNSSKPEANPRRGGEVVTRKKRAVQSAIKLREHRTNVGVPLGRKLPIDQGRNRVHRTHAKIVLTGRQGGAAKVFCQ